MDVRHAASSSGRYAPLFQRRVVTTKQKATLSIVDNQKEIRMPERTAQNDGNDEDEWRTVVDYKEISFSG
jgi:hypothetical protein